MPVMGTTEHTYVLWLDVPMRMTNKIRVPYQNGKGFLPFGEIGIHFHLKREENREDKIF